MTARNSATQYYFVECTDTCDKDVLGYNDGNVVNISKSGMLGHVPLSSPKAYYFYPEPYNKEKKDKHEFKRSPFFVQVPQINEEIYKRLETIGDESIVYIKNVTYHGLDYLPDGSIKFTHLNN